jgi:hypothetical protein
VKRFAIRTVRNSRVRIAGRTFLCERSCEHMEGQRFAFGLYWQEGKMLPFLALWGTEAEYRWDGNPDEFDGPRPQRTDDGHYAWECWREEPRP